MKDIDFDELDKAVSSVLSQVNAPAPKKEEAAAKTETGVPPAEAKPADQSAEAIVVKTSIIAGAGKGESVPVVEETSSDSSAKDSTVKDGEQNNETSPASTAVVAPKPTPLINPSRKAGRFMDVVHPSSDMATSPKAAPVPAGRISMAGRTLQPLLSSDGIKTDEVQPASEASRIETAEKQSDGAPKQLDDQLELSTTTAANESAVVGQAAMEPSATPAFIADAKVDKRPLGAFSEPAQASADPQPSVADNLESQDMPPMASASIDAYAGQGAKLPPELERDIVSVEADGGSMDDDAKEPKAPAAHSQASTGIDGTLSIPKQYQEVERSTDTEAHSLFDTNEYHPPLQVHADNNHRFLWVWVVIAILLLTGTAGLFAYWYMQGL